MTKNFTPITQRQYESLNETEQAAYRMEARNAASVIAQRNANNSADYLERLAIELHQAAQEKRETIARREARISGVVTRTELPTGGEVRGEPSVHSGGGLFGDNN